MPYKDPEKFRAYHAAYQRGHAEEHAAHQHAYLTRKYGEGGSSLDVLTPEENEKRKADARAYWREHAEEISVRRQAFRQGNEEYAAKHAARQRAYRKAHPEVRQADHARRRQRVSVTFTAEDRAESIAWRKLIKDDPCYYCGSAETHHVDHYVSLGNGGTDHWWNLVRACAPCNQRKNSMNGDEFIVFLRAGRLTGGVQSA
jgi:5-methylcytosine-specific restriction endonuclease McrA